MRRRLSKSLILFTLGGVIYVLMELVFRGRSHWTMFLIGGTLFLLIGALNEYLPWELPLLEQGWIGAGIITLTELASGCVLNLWLGLDIWDYSDMPLNLWGQICLPFSLLWIFVSMLAVVVDDFARWKLFGEERPHYRLI